MWAGFTDRRRGTSDLSRVRVRLIKDHVSGSVPTHCVASLSQQILLRPQGDERIDSRGAIRRDADGDGRDEEHRPGRCNECGHIGRRDAKQVTGEEAPRERSDRDSRNSTAGNEDQRFPADQTYDAASRRSERRADSNLTSPARDRVRENAVEAHAGEQQRKHTERGGNVRHHALA